MFKGIRYLLLKNPENLTQTSKGDELARWQEALKLNESLSLAYYLKEEQRQFWKQPSKNAAEAFLEAWCRRAQATSVRQLQTMAKPLQAHRNGLLNGDDEPIRIPASGCGPLEGINNKIEALQRRAYGYRNDEHLKQRRLTLHHTKHTITG